MKRHGFKGFMASHGVHESKRGGGSIGQSADPAKVFKGMKMPGQMGDEAVTVQNLKIVDVRESQNLIMIKGPVPGSKNGLLIIHHAIKKEAPPLRQPEPVEAKEPEVEETVADAPEVDAGEAKTEAEEAQVEASPSAEATGDKTEDKPEPEPAPEPTPEPEVDVSASAEASPEPEPAPESTPESQEAEQAEAPVADEAPAEESTPESVEEEEIEGKTDDESKES
jgi:hypothetical protein